MGLVIGRRFGESAFIEHSGELLEIRLEKGHGAMQVRLAIYGPKSFRIARDVEHARMGRATHTTTEGSMNDLPGYETPPPPSPAPPEQTPGQGQPEPSPTQPLDDGPNP